MAAARALRRTARINDEPRPTRRAWRRRCVLSRLTSDLPADHTRQPNQAVMGPFSTLTLNLNGDVPEFTHTARTGCERAAPWARPCLARQRERVVFYTAPIDHLKPSFHGGPFTLCT